MSDINEEIAKYEKVCSAAEDHGHQGFRITHGFFRLLISEWSRLKRNESRLNEATTNYVDSGKHLGAVRKWIKWNARNGEHVIWGSNEVLDYTFTVANLEEIAQCVADAMKGSE